MEFIDSISPVTSCNSIPVIPHFIQWLWKDVASISYSIHFEPQVVIFDTQQFWVYAISSDCIVSFRADHAWSMTEWCAFYEIFFLGILSASTSCSEISVFIKIDHRSADDGDLRMFIKEFYLFLESVRQRNIIAIHSCYEL